MADSNRPDDTRPTRADADDVADAMIGVDTRIFRTIWDTVVHTPRVLQAAYDGDRERYIPIIRLFLVLFGLQFAIMAFVGVPSAMTTDMFIGQSAESEREVLTWLENEGLDRAAVDQSLERAASLTTTLLTVLAALPYLLVFKAYRPSRSFYGHLLTYLLTTNVSYLIMLPILALAVFGNFFFWYMISMAVGLTMYFVATARVFATHYARTAVGVFFKTLGIFLLLPLTILIVGLGQFAVAELTLRIFHDTSFVDLFRTAAELQSS